MPKQRKPRDVEEEDEEEEEEFEEGNPFANIKIVDPAKVLAELAPQVRKRVFVLKKLHNDYKEKKKLFEEELRVLEKKYEALYKPIFDRRSELITGASEVNDQEGTEAAKLEEESKKAKDGEAATATPAETPAVVGADVKGVPEFWSKVFMNSDIGPELIQPHDEESLKALVNITTEDFDDGKDEDKSRGFRIHFHFSDNDFFTNKVLTKTYYVDEDDNMDSYDGTEIQWKEGKNLTKKIVIKKQKHKSGKQTRQVKKEEPQDSFFNFFNPLEKPDDDADDMEMEEFEQLLDTDFEIAQVIKENIIPNAIDYFLGENMPNMMQMGDFGGADEDGEEGAAPAAEGAQGEAKPECKQQ